MKSRNPLIQGVVIIPREIDLSKVRFLSKEEVIEYQEGVRTKYKDNPNALNSLDVISFDETLGEPKGSNFWALGELFSMGIPIAPTTTLDRLAEINPSTLTGTYEDVLSLVLRSEKDKYSKNNPVIQALMPQLKKRNVKRSIKYPVLISGAITPIEGKSEYGLVSRLNDQTNLHFNVGELAYSNHGKRFNTLDERGVPIFDENGTRTFYAKPSGLSRLYLDWSLLLDSGWDSLASSLPGSRVVVEVGGANKQKILSDYAKKIKAQKEKRQTILANIFRKAESELEKGYQSALNVFEKH